MSAASEQVDLTAPAGEPCTHLKVGMTAYSRGLEIVCEACASQGGAWQIVDAREGGFVLDLSPQAGRMSIRRLIEEEDRRG